MGNPDRNEEPKHIPYASTDHAEPTDKLVRLGPFGDLIEANLYRVTMDDEGIEVELAGENQAAALGPIYGRAYGGVHLLVRSSDEAAARRIIAEVERKRHDRLALENPPCPTCGGYKVNRVIGRDRLLGYAMIIVVPAFLLPVGQAWVCVIGPAVLLLGIYLAARNRLPQWRCIPCQRRYRAAKPDMLED